jgi:hypothetical protein
MSEIVAVIRNAKIVLVEEDDADKADPGNLTARRATADDVPIRTDLDRDHPLRGKCVLRVVPCGYPDCTLDDRGRLVPVDLRTGEPLSPANPPGPGGHEQPGDLGREVERG